MLGTHYEKPTSYNTVPPAQPCWSATCWYPSQHSYRIILKQKKKGGGEFYFLNFHKGGLFWHILLMWLAIMKGKKTVRKSLLDRSLRKKWSSKGETKYLEEHISTNLRMAGWNIGVSDLRSCLMSRPVIAGVAWSMISFRISGFNLW